MTLVLRSLLVVALGLSLVVLQSVLAGILPSVWLVPNLLLPIAIYLGVSHEVQLVRGALIAFVLGYWFDLVCGNLMSVQTFILVATFIVSRMAGLRLFLRGATFQVMLTFVVALLAGGATLALRAIFEMDPPFGSENADRIALLVVLSSAVSALAAPLIFSAVRKTDSLAVKRKEESAS